MSATLILFSLLAAEPLKADPRDLAGRIDARVEASLSAEGVAPAELADDAEFLRRLSLDLIGRIPTADEARAFLDDSNPDKRARMIDRLLESPEQAPHFARTWRALLLPEAETEPQVRYFVPGFEAWLEQRRRERTGFDAVIRELLAVPIARPGEMPQFVLRDMRRPNPLAFMAAKGAEPARIASSSVRLFLGLRLECAQCHDHPFDHWTREQFWNQAAFFAGIERRGKGTFAPLLEDPRKKTVPLMDTGAETPAVFLDHARPSFDDRPARALFAEWMTTRGNPYFGKAIVNRVWSQLMGRGLVDPVDDLRESNPPSHPQLLGDLAGAFEQSGFDVEHLQRAICLSRAYQRTSRQGSDVAIRPELYAGRQVKPLSGDQFFDSLAQAIAYEQPEDRGGNDDEDDPVRRRVLVLFDGSETTGDPETSVAQALTLMNGSVVDSAVSAGTGKRLKQILAQFPDSRERQVETLYLSTLSRFPSAEERRSIDDFFKQSDGTDAGRRLGDVFWVLLNSAEFRWNH